ncbi:histidine kinase [Chloroflexia bacterium SDU3-3]|nr:histidine kinase [Chloroflexia bacterium SDU3-3]
MSNQCPHQPALADTSVFLSYRWLTWLLAGAAVVWQGVTQQYILPLMAAALLNLLAAVLSRQYAQVSQRYPAILSLDIVYCVAMLMVTGGWAGPLSFYALSGVVLPALLFGWRGGFMAGLLTVSLTLALYLRNGQQPTLLVAQERNVELLAMLLLAPCFGLCFPVAVEYLRHRSARRAAPRRAPRSYFDEPSGGERGDIGGIRRGGGPARTADRSLALGGHPQGGAGPAIRTAAEPHVEDLRRMLYAPMPQLDMDFQRWMQICITRFSDYTGATARVTVLGRPHALRYPHQVVLQRLLQESLLNIHQHAHATKVDVTLRYDPLSIALLIQDNGIGLLDGSFERPRLHALRAMQYRFAELGGRLDVFETEGSGVTVRATAPLEP